MLRFLFDPISQVLLNVWGQLCCLYIGYSVARIMYLRRGIKEMKALEKEYDLKFNELTRQIEFQLKVKGHEGLTDGERLRELTQVVEGIAKKLWQYDRTPEVMAIKHQLQDELIRNGFSDLAKKVTQ